MLVGVMSDSHDNVPKIRRAVEIFKERGAQILVHAGDFVAPFAVKALKAFPGEVIAVYGNNDGEKAGIRNALPTVAEPPLRRMIGGRAFVIVHDIGKLEDRSGCDVIVHGHTHDLDIQEGPPLCINPGETGGWLRGRCTVVLLDTETLKHEIIEIPE